MSDSSGSSDRSLRPTEEAKPSQSPYGHGWPPPDDEISLFDIWDALVRRRLLIAAIFVGISVLAAGYAFMQPDLYRYQASIGIGENSSPDAAIAELESTFIPRAQRSVLGLNEGEPGTAPEGVSVPEVEVVSPENTSIVHLRIEGPTQNADDYRSILRTAATLLVGEHARLLEAERIRLSERREQLERRRERVNSQLEQIRTRLDQLLGTEGEGGAMLAFRIDGLQQRVGTLEDRLMEIDNDREEVTNDLDVLSAYAEAFTGDSTRDRFTRQQEARNQLAAVGDGLDPTMVTAAPQRSLAQVGTSGRLIIALGMVLGAMLGIFAAFLAEFVLAARRRRQEPAVEQT